MNQTIIRHEPVSIHDSEWEIHIKEDGVMVRLPQASNRTILWDELNDFDLLAKKFDFVTVATFRHLVETLGQLYEANYT